jgi:hypothetical protein
LSIYLDAKIHIHTNDENINLNIIKGIDSDNYTIYNKNTPVLFSFSQMIDCDVLIVGDSSLSIAASYVNNGLVLVPSNITCASGRDSDLHPLKGVYNSKSIEKYI